MHRILAFTWLVACSNGASKAAVAPVFTKVTAPMDVMPSADGTYTWHVVIEYDDPDDYATQMAITFSRNGMATTVNVGLQANALTQQIEVGPIASTYKGETFDYSFVLVDQSGLKSAPATGTVQFD